MDPTLDVDDALLAEAEELSGLKIRSQLVAEALRALIQRESARRLASLGGTEPQLQIPSRERRG